MKRFCEIKLLVVRSFKLELYQNQEKMIYVYELIDHIQNRSPLPPFPSSNLIRYGKTSSFKVVNVSTSNAHNIF